MTRGVVASYDRIARKQQLTFPAVRGIAVQQVIWSVMVARNGHSTFQNVIPPSGTGTGSNYDNDIIARRIT